jgi:tetratricopeptide (TPR) repeat protein
MIGNVWEWCQDAYVIEYEKLEQKDPFNEQGVARVLRGGSYNFSSERCRSADRNGYSADGFSSYFGFRVVVSVRPRLREALKVIREAAEAQPSNAMALNNYAWALLTFEDESLRDFKKALLLAQRAAELTKESERTILDTFALALFANGELKKAIETEERAIKLLPAETKPEDRKEYTERLARFKTAAEKK